jgi:predicted dehydrogenase
MKNGLKPLSLALIGMGVAGKARQKALADLPGFRLAALVSRRPEARTHTLEEMLSDSSIEAAVVSTENTDHAGTVRRCLSAGKHVLCDYPLAFSAAEAKKLFELAKKQGRTLHVEHIALLAEEHQVLKKQAAALGPLQRGEYLFQGGWNEKLENPSFTGPYPFLAISRLLQVADLFGPCGVESHRFEKSPQGFSLHFHLKFADGGTLGFTEERVAGLPRRRSLVAELKKGNLHWKAQTFGGGLFGKDLEWFRDRVGGVKECYYDETMMIRIIGYLEKV